MAVEFVKDDLVFTSDDAATSQLMLAIMGAVAEFERDMIKERRREGIAAAKARGEHLGRKVDPECETGEGTAQARGSGRR